MRKTCSGNGTDGRKGFMFVSVERHRSDAPPKRLYAQVLATRPGGWRSKVVGPVEASKGLEASEASEAPASDFVVDIRTHTHIYIYIYLHTH